MKKIAAQPKPSMFPPGALPPLVSKLREIPWAPPSQLPRIRGRRKLSYDLETCDPTLNALGPGVRRGAFIAGMAIKVDDEQPVYLPMRHEGGDNLDPGLIERWARHEMAGFDGEMFGANLLYDLDFSAEVGIEFPKVAAFHDVQVAEPLIDEWRYSYGLDALAKSYLGVGKDQGLLEEAAASYGWKDEKTIKQNLWRLPGRYAAAYGIGDVDLPVRIFPHQQARLEAEDLIPIYTIERKLMRILLGMRRRGVRVDVQHAGIVRRALKLRLDEQIKILRSFAGQRAELTEVATWIDALKDTGLPLAYTEPSEKFPNGQISTAKPWLEKHKHHPMIAAIMEGRKMETAINTFIDGHVYTHSINGRIHAEFNQLKNDDGRGTAARFSSSNPNLQNIPARDEEMSELIRGIFLADEDEVWQQDDYSQIEYRLLAHFAVGRGAAEFRQTYNDDPKTDYHKFVASMLHVDPEDKVKRKRVKNTNFAKSYGAQVPRLAATFGCSVEEAQEFVTEYEQALPFTVDTFDAAARWAQKRGFIVSVLNRRARFPFYCKVGLRGKARFLPENAPLPHAQALEKYGPWIERADTYKALNNKLQFSNADITKKAMVDADEAGLYATTALGWPLVTVHDEAGTSVGRSKEKDEAGRELTRLMEGVVKLRVPIRVESKRGPNWGACASYV